MSRTHANKFIEEVCAWYLVWYETDDNKEEESEIQPEEVWELWDSAQEYDEDNVRIFLESVSEKFCIDLSEIFELWRNTHDPPVEKMFEELTSNTCPEWLSSEEDLDDFMNRHDVIEYVQRHYSSRLIKNLKLERIFEITVHAKLHENLVSFSEESSKNFRNNKYANSYIYRSWGNIRRGFLEIRGNNHLDDECDEHSLYYLPEKFAKCLDETEHVTVILCGQSTDFSRDLINKTKHYLQYLEGNVYPLEYRKLFDHWKACKFGGYHAFDDVFGENQSDSEICEEND